MAPLLEVLRRNRRMGSASEVAAFEQALAGVAATRDPSLLSELHLILDDECHHQEVMFGLVHLLESFEMETQLQAFLDVLPQLQTQAPQWAKILHFRILNDDAARTCYSDLFRAAVGSSRVVARRILQDISETEEGALREAADSICAQEL